MTRRFKAAFVFHLESHYVKNPKARRTENVVDIVKKAKRKILLTGTPALARPSDLFSQIDAILPGALQRETGTVFLCLYKRVCPSFCR